MADQPIRTDTEIQLRNAMAIVVTGEHAVPARDAVLQSTGSHVVIETGTESLFIPIADIVLMWAPPMSVRAPA
jgi:hypothetical protein